MQFAKPLNEATWSDLTEIQPPDTFTPVEAIEYNGHASEEDKSRRLSDIQREFLTEGVLKLPNFFHPNVLQDYLNARQELPMDRSVRDNFWGGWSFPTPYMICEELKQLGLNPALMSTLQHIVGHEMGLHLCLTGWVSTERNFHQDTYLNPPYLWSNYVAVWIALEDIHPDSGPFQYVPGSHRWETLRQQKLFSYLTSEQRSSPHWPTFTQDEVARVCEEEIARRGSQVETYLPKKGDVLIWHANLVHRGSEPKNKDLLRKSLICHYSAVEKRVDMPMRRRDPVTNGVYFDLPVAGAVRP